MATTTFKSSLKSNARQVPAHLLERAMREPYYIYNVGPEQWVRSIGAGEFLIRGNEGAEYSEPLVIPSEVYEHKMPDDLDKQDYFSEEGLAIVQDIMCNGVGANPNNDYTKRGVFVSRSNPPKKAEIAAAKEARRARNQGLIAQANRLYQVNGGMVTNRMGTFSNIGDEMFQAAKEEGVSPAWAKRTAATVDCKNCGSPVMPTAAKCPACHAVQNTEAWKTQFPAEFAMVAASQSPAVQVAAK